jgi:hypothetical protein
MKKTLPGDRFDVHGLRDSAPVPLQHEAAQAGIVPCGIPVFSLRGVFSPLVTIPIAIVFLTMLFAPEDILTRYRAAAWLANHVRGGLLAISKHADIANHANSTAYPEVALLGGALLWLFFAWNSAVYCAQGFLNMETLISLRRPEGSFTAKELRTMLLGFLVVAPDIAILTMIPGDFSASAGITTHNRIGYALLGTIALFGASLSTGFLAPYLALVVKTNCKGEQE